MGLREAQAGTAAAIQHRIVQQLEALPRKITAIGIRRALPLLLPIHPNIDPEHSDTTPAPRFGSLVAVHSREILPSNGIVRARKRADLRGFRNSGVRHSPGIGLPAHIAVRPAPRRGHPAAHSTAEVQEASAAASDAVPDFVPHLVRVAVPDPVPHLVRVAVPDVAPGAPAEERVDKVLLF